MVPPPLDGDVVFVERLLVEEAVVVLMAVGATGDLDVVGVGRRQAGVVVDLGEPVAALIVGVLDVELDRGNLCDAFQRSESGDCPTLPLLLESEPLTPSQMLRLPRIPMRGFPSAFKSIDHPHSGQQFPVVPSRLYAHWGHV